MKTTTSSCNVTLLKWEHFVYCLFLKILSQIFTQSNIILLIKVQHLTKAVTHTILKTAHKQIVQSTNQTTHRLWCSGYHYLHNFIQQSLNSDSAKVQLLLAACRRFAMVRISDNVPGWKLGPNVFCESNMPQKQFTIKLFKLPFSGKKNITQTLLTIVPLILENKNIEEFWVTFLNFHFSKQNSSICVIREAKIMHLRRIAVELEEKASLQSLLLDAIIWSQH